MRVVHYFDYKSPYAYLAQAANQALAATPGIRVETLPYTLQIPKYLGSAELDDSGRDTVGTRNDHQWRRVRYSYMDCRREANRRGLTVRGPRRIYDSAAAHIAFLWCARQGDFLAFHNHVFEQFWQRALDIEDVGALIGVMTECGLDACGFDDFLAGAGRDEYERVQREAEEAGVFGVPSWLVDGELFWGIERLERACEKLGVPLSAVVRA